MNIQLSKWPRLTFPELDLPSIFTDGVDAMQSSGLSISEDTRNFYVDAAVPGLTATDVEVTTDSGMLWIKGQKTQEEKERKYYRKSASSFNYRVAIPADCDTNLEPEAKCVNGVLHVTLPKVKKSEPKKVSVKTG